MGESAKAWDFGPVFPRLYEHLRPFGKGMVTATVAESDPLRDDEKAKTAVKLVREGCKNYSPSQLVNISHMKGSPWDTVWNVEGNKYQLIPDEEIRKYYLSRVKVRDLEPA